MSTYLGGFDTPRQLPLLVKLSVFFGDVLFIIGLFFTLFGMVFAVIFGSMVDFSSMSFSPDKTVVGVISSIEETGASENKRSIYKYNYQYSKDGDLLKSGSSFDSGRDLKVGDRVEVEYESASDRSCIKDMGMAPFSPLLILLLGIFPMVGIAMLSFGIWKALRNLDLLSHGILAKAKVTHKEQTNTKINNRYVFEVFFEFKTHDGKLVKSSVKTHKPYLVEDEPEEMMVYKSEEPERATLLDALPKSVKKHFLQN